MDWSEERVVAKIKEDVVAADFLISMFMAALQSYRHHSLIRPFPKDFRKQQNDDVDDANDFDRLRAASESVPPISSIIKDGSSNLNSEVHKVLRDVLYTKQFNLISRPHTLYDNIQQATGTASYEVRPKFVIELVHHNDFDPERQKFINLKEQYGSLIAYHGTALENMHSILRNGFLNHFNKTSLFGEGTYLSSDLSVCMGFTRSAAAWEKSLLGSKLTCVAVCEVIKHPSVKLPGGNTDPDIDRSSTIGGDKLPDTYVVVPSNEHLRLKYVFIYPESSSGRGATRSLISGVGNFLHTHSFVVSMLLYGLILLAIGMWQNRSFRRWWLQLFRK
eukprot:m.22295 g.22295  ORF g.22295 m.22295 type:complete len:333 (-) comp7384_c0_seq1:71-1069(-)